MWWPWRSRGAEPDSAGSTGTGSPDTPHAAPRDGWRTLPALQRTTHEAESACHLDTFPAALSTRHDPRFLEPLGHNVEPTAPAGRVEGLVRPTGRSGTEFALPPSQASVGAAAAAASVQRIPSVQRRVTPAATPTALPPTSPKLVATTPLLVAQRTREPAAERTPEPEALATPANLPSVAPTIGLDEHAPTVGTASPSGHAEGPMPIQRGVMPAAGVDVVTPDPASVAPNRVPVLARELAAPATPADEPSVAPTVGLDEAAPTVETASPSGQAAEGSMPIQRDVKPAAGLDMVTPNPASVAPNRVPVVARTLAAPATAATPRTPNSPGSLPEMTARPVPALPLPVMSRSPAVLHAAVSPEAPDARPDPQPPITESADGSAEPAKPTAIDLLGERPIRVDEPTVSTQLPPAPIATTRPTITAPAVQRAVTRPEDPQAGPGGTASRPAVPVQRSVEPTPSIVPPTTQETSARAVQRSEVAAVPQPLLLAPPTVLWPPSGAAAPPVSVRPVPAPGLTVQALAVDQAPAPAQTVQRVVAEPLPSAAAAVLPKPAVAPTPFVPDRLDSATQTSPGGEATRIAGAAAPVTPSLHVQRSTATIPAPLPVPVGSRPPVPVSPQAQTYEAISANIWSMPLQRLFSATTPQAPRPELPTRPSGAAPEHADHHDPTISDATGGTEVAIRWDPPQATLQRAKESSGEAAGAPAPETPSAAGAATALGSAAPTPAKPSGTDMDELARRLYAPMSALLRAELWLDRERSGRSMTR